MTEVTDWDDRWREMRNEEIAALQRQQQAREDDQLRYQEEQKRAAEVFERTVPDIARWTIRKYNAAKIPPLPIYCIWSVKNC